MSSGFSPGWRKTGTLPATSVGCPTEKTGSAVSPQATATTGAES
ncbi:hypothetical protein [Streptomyces sp. NPDC054962]